MHFICLLIYLFLVYWFRLNYPRQEIYSLQIWKPGFYNLQISVAQQGIEPQTLQLPGRHANHWTMALLELQLLDTGDTFRQDIC